MNAILDQVAFGQDGLIAAIAQQHDSGAVLMLAWMNRDALAETLRTGQACYWSRSRQRLWRKGETSGQSQRVVSVRLACDRDAVLLLVDQHGVACHTGRASCFFQEAGPEGLRTLSEPVVSPAELYTRKHDS